MFLEGKSRRAMSSRLAWAALVGPSYNHDSSPKETLSPNAELRKYGPPLFIPTLLLPLPPAPTSLFPAPTCIIKCRHCKCPTVQAIFQVHILQAQSTPAQNSCKYLVRVSNSKPW